MCTLEYFCSLKKNKGDIVIFDWIEMTEKKMVSIGSIRLE